MSEKSTPFADRYTIHHELGRGSFGVVYRASDARLGNRPVALKLLHPQLAVEPESLRLFEKEAGMLANLRHDHIVTVYDAGLWQGRRYLAMEFIDGPTLAQVVAEQGAQPPARVATWLQQAAAALAHAHAQKLIHRDIKTANLLLDLARNRIYMTDFGLAWAVEQSGGSSSGASLHVLTGTAAYRAPEVRRTGHTVASDLYSLGVVAYELLAGKRPFPGADPLDLMMAHASDPVPPLPTETPDWLIAVILRLLEKLPERRYPNAEELLVALKENVEDSGKQTYQDSYQLDELILDLNEVVTSTPEGKDLQIGGGNHSDTFGGIASEVQSVLDLMTPGPREIVHLGPGVKIDDFVLSPDGKTLAISTSGNVKLFDWNQFYNSYDSGRLLPHLRKATSMSWSFDSLKLATTSDEVIRIWDAHTYELVLAIDEYTNDVQRVVWSPDGLRIVSAAQDQTVRVWNAITGELLHTIREHKENVIALDWSPDGTYLATSDGRAIHIWESTTGHIYRTLEDSGFAGPDLWSPNGRFLLVSEHMGETVKIYDNEMTEVIAKWDSFTTAGGFLWLFTKTHSFYGAKWSPDGAYLAGRVSNEEGIRTWEMASNSRKEIYPGWSSSIWYVWSGDGTTLISGLWNGRIAIWNPRNGKMMGLRERHDAAVIAITWSPDSTRLYSLDATGHLIIWRSGSLYSDIWSTIRSLRRGDSYDNTASLKWSPDGHALACFGNSYSENILDPSELYVINTFESIKGASAGDWSPDGRYIAAGYRNGMLRIWKKAGPLLYESGAHGHWIQSVAWSPDGARIATASRDKTIKVWDAQTKDLLLTLTGNMDEVNHVMWSRDSDRLISCSQDANIHIWDAATGDLLQVLSGHTASVHTVEWSPDFALLASCSSDKTVRIWDANSGAMRQVLYESNVPILTLAWSPDGRFLAMGEQDGTVRVWIINL